MKNSLSFFAILILAAIDNLEAGGSIAGGAGLKLAYAAMLAKSARGDDEDGYRSELIRLINTVKDMRVLADKE